MGKVLNDKCLKKGTCLILISAFLSMMVGCGSDSKQKKTAFPTDKDGWPKKNVALINGKEYPLEKIEHSDEGNISRYEIRLKLDRKKNSQSEDQDSETMEVTLPKQSLICFWDIDPKDLDLISYEKTSLPVKTKETLEGATSVLQTFRYMVPMDESTSVSFKWSNVNEMEKAFSDQQEYYLLTITTYQ